MKDKMKMKKMIEKNEKEVKEFINDTKEKEQINIKSLMDIIICENKEALNELAK